MSSDCFSQTRGSQTDGSRSERQDGPSTLELLARLSSASSPAERWEILAQTVKTQAPDAVVLVNSVDERRGRVRMESACGVGPAILRQIGNLSGKDPFRRSYPLVAHLRDQYLSAPLREVPGGLPELGAGFLSASFARTAQSLLGVSRTYTGPIRSGDVLLGVVHILTRSRDPLDTEAIGHTLTAAAGILAATEELRSNSVLLHTTDSQVWFLQDERTYGDLNRAHADFFGWNREEARFRDLRELLPPEVAETCRVGNRQVFESARTIHTEEWVCDAQGRERLLAITKTPYVDADGQVSSVVCTAHDVTHARHNEQELARHAGLQQELAGASTSFLEASSSEDFRSAVRHTLARLAEAAGVDRSFFTLLSGEAAGSPAHVLESYEWCAEGLSPLKEQLATESPALATGKSYAHPPLPEAADPEDDGRRLIDTTGVQSLLVVPVRNRDGLRGIVGFASQSTPRVWSPTDLETLRTLADIVAAALQRLRLEAELTAGNTRLRNILEGTGAATWEWRLDTDEIVLDERWFAMIGYRPEDFPGTTIETWKKLTHPEDLQQAEALLREHVAGTSEQYACEIRMRHREGYWVWVQDRGRVVEWSDAGEALRMLGTHIDVSERRRSEEELERFFTVSLDLLTIVDRQGRFLRLNNAWEEVLGFSPAEMEGRRFTDYVHPEDRSFTQEAMDELLENGELVGFVNRYRNSAGAYRYLEWHAHVERVHTGARIGAIYAAARDVTDRIEREEAAMAASRAKSDFLANMSHELRTPLNGIVGMVSLLGDAEVPAPYRGYIEGLRSSADTLVSLIDDILDFSKIEAGRLELELRGTDLHELLGNAISTVRQSAEQRGLDVALELSEEVPRRVETDPVRLTQVLVNLLSNAVKFTETGSITVEVQRVGMDPGMDRGGAAEPAACADAGRVRLRMAVRDTGIGISEEQQSAIFHSFTQADPSTTRRFGGTGLGLAISNRILEQMESRLELESVPGDGSSFFFTVDFRCLELLSADDREVPASEEEERAAAEAESTRLHAPEFRVLVAEDERINLIVATRLIARLFPSAEILTAGDGDEVLQRFRESGPDLILMDVQMPGRDGYEATRQIRELEATERHTPIIALTAGVVEGERERCLEAGMDDYLSKPVDQERLGELIRRWLDRPPGR